MPAVQSASCRFCIAVFLVMTIPLETDCFEYIELSQKSFAAVTSTVESATARTKQHLPGLNIFGGEFANIHDFFVIGRELGRGKYGIVRICQERVTGELYACKSLKKSLCVTRRDQDGLRNEVVAMELLKCHPDTANVHAILEDQEVISAHPDQPQLSHVANSIVPLIFCHSNRERSRQLPGIFTTEIQTLKSSSLPLLTLHPLFPIQECHILMGLCDGGDLFDRIRERRRYPEADAAVVVLSLVSVVAACQRMGLIHRDLKPENVLLQHRDCHTSVTVVDFGFAEFVKPGEGQAQLHSPCIPASYLFVCGITCDANSSHSCHLSHLSRLSHLSYLSSSFPFILPTSYSLLFTSSPVSIPLSSPLRSPLIASPPPHPHPRRAGGHPSGHPLLRRPRGPPGSHGSRERHVECGRHSLLHALWAAALLARNG